MPPDGSAGLWSTAASSPAVVAATTDAAWLAAMLRFEAALAASAAECGLVSAGAARAAVAACDPAAFDVTELAAAQAEQATPVIALVARLRALAGVDGAAAVHVAATSQDVVDTAAMLVARDAVDALGADVDAVRELLADLARRHRATPQVGRTLGQHATPITFGAWCATRLAAVADAHADLLRVREEQLAVQLGGPAGTLPGAGPHGADLVRGVAERLALSVPAAPWHTARGRVGRLAAALAVLAGELAAAAQDLVLLSSSDVAELVPAAPGGSSSMPHKRNPARAVLAVAAAHRVPFLTAALLAGMPQELQRAAGRWQAEPATLTDLLRAAGSVAHHTRAALTGLGVDEARMRSAVQALPPEVDRDLGTATALVDAVLAAHDPLPQKE